MHMDDLSREPKSKVLRKSVSGSASPCCRLHRFLLRRCDLVFGRPLQQESNQNDHSIRNFAFIPEADFLNRMQGEFINSRERIIEFDVAKRKVYFTQEIHLETEAQDWLDGLSRYIEHCRQETPLPNRSDLTESDECQCSIVGSSILNWLRRYGPAFLRERQVLAPMLDISPDPAIVFTSNIPGLVAANIVFEGCPEEYVFLSESELQPWLEEHPDDEYRWHVNFWSAFRDMTTEMIEAAEKKYPLPSGSSYWLHREGTMWGKLAGRGVDHLWQWDGQTPVLLEEAFMSWVS